MNNPERSPASTQTKELKLTTKGRIATGLAIGATLLGGGAMLKDIATPDRLTDISPAATSQPVETTRFEHVITDETSVRQIADQIVETDPKAQRLGITSEQLNVHESPNDGFPEDGLMQPGETWTAEVALNDLADKSKP